MIGAVKCAVFMEEEQRRSMAEKIRELNVKSVLILGTSEKMTKRIAASLELGEVKKFIKIEDIATKEEIETALETRNSRGMHTIPVSTFAIKKDFSGLWIDKVKIFLGARKGQPSFEETKSVVRPTFSYFGDFHIRNRVICDIAGYAAQKLPEVYLVSKVQTENRETGVDISITLSLRYGCSIVETSNSIIKNVAKDVEYMTSLNVENVNVVVKEAVVAEK